MGGRKDLNFKEFETILKEEKERIEKNVKAVKLEVSALAIEDDIDDVVDMAELQIDNLTDQKILRQLEAEAIEINAALSRLKRGNYGICEKTGESIPIERLRAIPYSRTTVGE